MLRSILFVLVLCLVQVYADCQNMVRVRNVTDSLCSPKMNGRGYTFQGDKLAAHFIENEFKKAGLSFFEQGAFQEFSLDVNVFDGNMSLNLGGKELKAGTEFIAYAASPRGYGRGKLIYLDSARIQNPDKWLLQERFEKSIIAYRQEDEQAVFKMPEVLVKKIMLAKCHIIIAPKLTHFISRNQQVMPKMVVLADAFTPKARKASFQIDASVKYGYQTQNIIGYIKGSVKPDSFLVYTAHYDHLGNMGEDTYFPGANDNASGVAMLIEMANYYTENPPSYSVAFIAFGAEEAGLVGSRYYTALPFFPLQSIKFLINLDLFGTGSEGTTVVNGSIFKEEFQLLQHINEEKKYLKRIAKRGEAANSDHYFFYQAGIKCFFFYLQGDWPHYHDVNDTIPLPYSHFSQAFGLIKDFSDALMAKP